ncbi:MAG TPA: NAD(P)/FAD-dependent oxidoreductase [Polyangiaceae bacterium]|nr:NAD(P)/FAD-dependent oxidoreductase [Polyangiaceae bacterium]
MKRLDAYQLANLPLSTRVVASFALILGLALFWSGWAVSVFFVDWEVTLLGVLSWGHRLMGLPQALLRALFAGHVASLLLLFGVARALFRRAPLPRLTRRALFGLASALALADLACWLLVASSAVARSFLGAAVTLLGGLLTYFVASPLRAMWRRRSWKYDGGEPVRVVVVGGGFAGLYAALGLDGALGYHPKLELTVIDRKNYFLFPPLLPSVAAGAIETRQVTYPFRRLFEATNVRFKKETVVAIDVEHRVIRSRVDVDEHVSSGALVARHDETPFDYLVLAPGSITNSFRTEGIEHAFFMRELSDAIALRNHVIDCFETAARERDPNLVAEMLRFVIVGAGPTGVEVASELRDLVDQVLLRRYPEIDPALVEVIVVDPGERILNGWDPRVANDASAQLTKIGVRIQRGGRVVKLGADWIAFNDGTKLETRTCVWCAGVSPSELLRACGLVLNKSGRAEVGADCRAVGHDRIFVLGDAAQFPTADGRGLPPLGQVAFQQGAHTAKNLVRLLRGEAPLDFRYFDFGQLVSVGHHFAAVKLVGVRLSGFLAWFVWRTLYLGKLVGFGNKLRVVLDWTLDLFIERSISQLHTERHRHPRPAPTLQSRAQRASM